MLWQLDCCVITRLLSCRHQRLSATRRLQWALGGEPFFASCIFVLQTCMICKQATKGLEAEHAFTCHITVPRRDCGVDRQCTASCQTHCVFGVHFSHCTWAAASNSSLRCLQAAGQLRQVAVSATGALCIASDCITKMNSGEDHCRCKVQLLVIPLHLHMTICAALRPLTTPKFRLAATCILDHSGMFCCST